jgi:hypothetical protein
MAEGRFDRPELDEVDASLGRAVADNRLRDRDRDMLTGDPNRVREGVFYTKLIAPYGMPGNGRRQSRRLVHLDHHRM